MHPRLVLVARVHHDVGLDRNVEGLVPGVLHYDVVYWPLAVLEEHDHPIDGDLRVRGSRSHPRKQQSEEGEQERDREKSDLHAGTLYRGNLYRKSPCIVARLSCLEVG